MVNNCTDGASALLPPGNDPDRSDQVADNAVDHDAVRKQESE